MTNSSQPQKDLFKNESIDLLSICGSALVAEDDPDIQGYISFFLSKTKLEVTMVENGQLAVEAAVFKDFDIVLMDMQMPVMDGYAATRMLREKGKNAPIVALTADARSTTVERCIAAGCNAYISKPFDSSELFPVLWKHCGKASQEAKGGDESLLVLQSMDPGFLQIVLNFTNRLPGRLVELQDAAKSKDWARLVQLSHKLRGAAFAYPRMKLAVRKLEEAACAESVESSTACLQKIVALVETIEGRKHELEALLTTAKSDAAAP